MAHILSDRVKETTTTTGTGTLALLGAVAQFRAFSSVMANNDTTLYAIVGQTGTEWEVGLGTWTTGNNLARTTVLASSNAGSVVTLSAGTKNVFMTLTLLGRWPQLNLSLGSVINWDAGDVTMTHATNRLTVAGGVFETDGILQADGAITTPSISALTTTATVPALSIDPGTLMTTPSEGAIESDGNNFYGTTDPGNRGIIPLVNLIRADAVRTYTSNTSAQAIFNSPANGRLTIETGTYRFHGVFSFSAMSATSGNRSFNILGAGTATVVNIVYGVAGADTAVATVLAGGFSHNVAVASTTSAVPATVAVGMLMMVDGSFECSVAGTIIPSTTMVTAAASTMAIGSYLEIWRIGDTSRVSVGQWD